MKTETEQTDQSRGETDTGTENQAVENVARVILKFDGMEVDFEMHPDQTIIEAAQEAGYYPPYSCQMAYCATCRAKLEEGEVDMDDSDILTDEELEEGFVLTCQSHPKTRRVVLDYDAL